MINEKMAALGNEPSAIRQLFEYGNRRRAEIGAENVYDFSLGNPSTPTPQAVTDALTELLNTKSPVALHGYTSAPGALSTREAIARHIRQTHGENAKAENIYMTCGAAASLTVSLHALLIKGDEVVVPTPFFPEYRVFIEKAGGKLVGVPSRTTDFGPDIEKMAQAIGAKTKAVLINSPNNPTGAVWSEKDIKDLAAVLEEKERQYDHPIYLISDEPYRELVYGDVKVPYVTKYYHNTLVCYSYSKSLSLPGERIGYIYVPERTEGDVFAAVCGAGRALGFVCAPSLMQYMVEKCVDVLPDLTDYEYNRTTLLNALRSFGYEVIEPKGAFYLFFKSPEPDAVAFCEKAKKYDLLLVPANSFDGPGYVRISYCVSRQTVEGSLAAFEKLIKEYK